MRLFYIFLNVHFENLFLYPAYKLFNCFARVFCALNDHDDDDVNNVLVSRDYSLIAMQSSVEHFGVH